MEFPSIWFYWFHFERLIFIWSFPPFDSICSTLKGSYLWSFPPCCSILFLNEEDVIIGVFPPNLDDLIQFEGNMLLIPHNPFLLVS